MGNALGGKKRTKVMKMDGETLKVKTPVKVWEVLKEQPGKVLLEAEEVKHYGIRAKPMEGNKELMAKRLYFMVDGPGLGLGPGPGPGRVRSGIINMSAKERLESLVLARRSASDLTIMNNNNNENKERVRLKVRLPRGEVERLITASQTQTQLANNIMALCIANASASASASNSVPQTKKKRVSFMPIIEGGSPIAVA